MVRRPAAARHLRVPSASLEYSYYLVTTYSLVSASVGLEVPLVAAGMTILLAAMCSQQIRPGVAVVLAPVRLLLACAVSFVAVQLVVHGVSPAHSVIRQFILWISGIIIVQSLLLRPGFLRRCTFIIFGIGLIAVPGLILASGGSVERAKAGFEIGGNLKNANGLGGWFGFCLVSFAILGLQTNRLTRRTFFWLAAAASLLVVGLSVSRGVLIASAVAIIVGFRGVLKRGVVPLLLLVLIGAAISSSGTFGHVLSLYEARGMEDTGRLHLWPHVVDRIVAAPLTGFGISAVATFVPELGTSISTPHNSFLFLALSAGIVPFVLWALFWIQTGRDAFSSRSLASPYRVAFFLYALVIVMLGDIGTPPWFLLTCAVAAGGDVAVAAGRLRRVPRVEVRPPSWPARPMAGRLAPSPARVLDQGAKFGAE